MFDFSLAEVLLIVVVSVVFIGPKDLPVVVKAIVKIIKTLRGFANEIKHVFEEISRETGIADVKETLDAEIRLIQGDDGKMYESYTNLSSNDDVTLATQHENTAFGSAFDTDSKANQYYNVPTKLIEKSIEKHDDIKE